MYLQVPSLNLPVRSKSMSIKKKNFQFPHCAHCYLRCIFLFWTQIKSKCTLRSLLHLTFLIIYVSWWWIHSKIWFQGILICYHLRISEDRSLWKYLRKMGTAVNQIHVSLVIKTRTKGCISTRQKDSIFSSSMFSEYFWNQTETVKNYFFDN